MIPLPTWVLGAGGQARETQALLELVGCDVNGRALEFVGLVDAHQERDLEDSAGALVLGFGFPDLRAAVLERFAGDPAFCFPTLVHPLADIGDRTALGEGVVIFSGCVVTTDVRIGDGSLLNPRSGIGHDAVLGRCCVVNPGANISGSVTIGDEVLIGSGATILQGLVVGSGATVGAGAVVTENVPAGSTVVGIPARSMASPGEERS